MAVDGPRILGYVTVATGHIEIERVPAKLRRSLPQYPLPILRLARLAVDRSAREGGVGKALLRHAFLLARRLAADYGCLGVVVDAKPAAVEFYARFGFQTLDVVEGDAGSCPRPTAMFLGLSEIEAAAGSSGPKG